MSDNVNTDVRHTVSVRPFMPSILIHAEDRLVRHPENAVESWGDVDPYRLIGAAQDHLDRLITDGDLSTAAEKERLADALNYIAMAYDTFEQQERGDHA